MMTPDQIRKTWAKLIQCFPSWKTTTELRFQYMSRLRKYTYECACAGIDSYFMNKPNNFTPNLRHLLDAVEATARARHSDSMTDDTRNWWMGLTHLERMEANVSALRRQLTRNRFENASERDSVASRLRYEENRLARIKQNNPRWIRMQRQMEELDT